MPLALFGSGKKAVVPVDGTAAGADAVKQPVPENSVTFDTFKNKVHGLGLADEWQESTLKQVFQVLDTNSNDRLEEGEFKESVGRVCRLLEGLLGEPEAAVAAGVIAVGSRVVKSTYEEPMNEWSEKADALLPKQVVLSTSTAAVQAIGPCYLAVHKERKQIDQLKASLEALKDADLSYRTKVEYQLAEAAKREQTANEKLDAAVARVDAVMLSSAEAISPGLARDGDEYGKAVADMMEEEPGVMEELSKEVEALVNDGPVEVGEKVEVVVDGKMARAKVRRAVDAAKGEYELSLWTEVTTMNQKYEAGFDTRAPKLITVPRRKVHANRKHKQKLSTNALKLAKSRAEAEAKARGKEVPKETEPKHDSPEYMSLLYFDAERTLPSLHDLAGEVKKALPDSEPIVAPLKGEARAAYKTLDKYAGDYRRLTDLARMTIKCPTLRAALAALRFLAKHTGFVIVLIKNRLTFAFDASATGGYRDLLLNLKSKTGDSDHIVEVQITLTPLLAIKAGGGHAAYQVARVHGFFEEEVYRHEGALDAAVLERLRCGILRVLVCNGKSVGLAAHFEALLAALRAPSCQLRELRLAECDWPEGRTLSELADALPARGLRVLDVDSMHTGGVLPPALFEKCAEAELVDLCAMDLTGRLPVSVGKCVKVKELYLWGNQLEGSIPDELGDCAAMEDLQLADNKLTGRVPASLGKCAKLKVLYLWGNQLEGSIPDELGDCAAMEVLVLHQNKLTGGVPASLGKCAKLKQLRLEENRFKGAVPHICDTVNCVMGRPWKIVACQFVPPGDPKYGVPPW